MNQVSHVNTLKHSLKLGYREKCSSKKGAFSEAAGVHSYTYTAAERPFTQNTTENKADSKEQKQVT